MSVNRQMLREHFPPEALKSRKTAGNQTFTYVNSEEVLQRLILATEGEFTWEVLSIEYIEAGTIQRYDRDTRSMLDKRREAFFMVHGRLTIPSLGSFDGIGTSVEETEDSPKAAETDALKRCAVKTGVALYLYERVQSAPGAVSTQDIGRHGQSPSRSGGAPVRGAQGQQSVSQEEDSAPTVQKDYHKRFNNLCTRFWITKEHVSDTMQNIGANSFYKGCERLEPVYQAMKKAEYGDGEEVLLKEAEKITGKPILGLWELDFVGWNGILYFLQHGESLVEEGKVSPGGLVKEGTVIRPATHKQAEEARA